MRIESVTAHAFGPLVGAKLELAPGMTVVAGGNESAKSSWHSALYSALCGRRRGKGAPTKEEKRYAELRRPWDGVEWRVSTMVVLDDDRRIEISQDLDGGVDCRATDTALARDVSADIMFEGSPDASRFLGLDRKSFAATACVNQTELLTVLAAAGGLQEHLQRAAATAGTDATAAAALECLEKFSRDNVGLDRANSTKPLRAAKNRLAHTEAALTRARSEHEEYLLLVEDADRQREQATQAATRTEAAERTAHAHAELLTAVRAAALTHSQAERAHEKATQAARDLARIGKRLARAEQIHARFHGVAPVGLAGQDDLARTVSTALAAWQAAPAPRPLTGPAAKDLRAQLAALPDVPVGDLAIAPAVRELVSAHEQVAAIAAAHGSHRPSANGTTTDPTLAAAIEAGPARLRELAAALSSAEAPETPGVEDPAGLPGIAQGLEEARERCRVAGLAAETAQQAADAAGEAYRQAVSAALAPAPVSAPPSPARRIVLLAVAATVAVAGVGLLVAGQTVPGVVVLIVALVAGGLGVASKAAPRPTPGPQATTGTDPTVVGRAQETTLAAEQARRTSLDADRLVAEYEGRHAAAAAAARRAENVRADIVAQCAARGVPAEVAALRTLAAQAEQMVEARATTAAWTAQAEQYRSGERRALDELRSALTSRGVPGAADPAVAVADAMATYGHACADRAEQAVAAGRRDGLEQALADRVTVEAAAAEAAATRERAVGLLTDAAAAVGVTPAGSDAGPADVGALVAALTAWQGRWAEQAQASENEQKEWAALVTLLEGATVEQLRVTVAALHDENETLTTASRDAAGAHQAAATRRDAAAAAAGVDRKVAREAEAVADTTRRAQDEVVAARRDAAALAAVAENAEGALAERSRSLRSVPEAEEAWAAARTELDRVSELATTLDLTGRFLSRAQEQVHRDIAPVLADTLRKWLPSVTEGRYVDAMVDPASLHVQVRGASGRWRHADRLSVGTAEQVYLLLRVALAQHLTSGESCPLLLDDVTVQADVERTDAVLDLLLRLSEQRQVVLFAQEPAVAAWAREHLIGDRHALREMTRIATD